MLIARARKGLAIGILALSAVAAIPLLTTVLSRANSSADLPMPGAAGSAAVEPRAAALVADLVPPSTIVDPVVTGAITPAASPSLPLQQQGSADFRAAVKLIVDGERASAFEAAKRLPDPAERHAIQWAAIYFGNGEVGLAGVKEFARTAPDFETPQVFRTRIEQALLRAGVGHKATIAELGGSMPVTVSAQIALAEAYVEDGQRARAARIARAIWTENVLDKSTEAKVLDKLGNLLDNDAHWARAMHLMMHDRATGVERIMKFLTPAQRSLATARNAVSRDAKNAKKLLDDVDPSMHGNPVYLFSRAQRARKFELWDQSIAYFDRIKGTVADADEVWYERRALTRQLIALGEMKRAYRAADGYRDGPEGRQVEAHFHAGWIALSFLADPKSAAQHFEGMVTYSTLPDSVTQANYWLGRARAELGDVEGAKAAWEAAARFGTVYYGQLARSALGQKSFELREMPSTEQVEADFARREPVRAIELLARNGQQQMAVSLLRDFAAKLTDGGELVLAARIAQSLGAHNLAISIADNAERSGVPMDLFNFPKDGLPTTRIASIDHAAVYAITRQESRFQVDAISSAGARGLMQLMPATAEETAGKLGVAYSKSKLTTDAEYNTLLGSTYLKAQLERFDGSLVLAAAAYNAGGGNARKWIKAFGDPRSEAVDPVVWVELIPVQETRTYVKRVLGNYLVYRARLGKDDLSIESALRKIPS